MNKTLNQLNKGLRDTPRSMPTNDNYRDNYDAIFRKDKEEEEVNNHPKLDETESTD